MTIQLVADFPDYAPEPRPNFAAHVRHSHPYGVVGEGRLAEVIVVELGNDRKRLGRPVARIGMRRATRQLSCS